MRTVLSIAWLNMRLLASDRSAFFWMIVLPVAFTFVLGIAFSGGGRSGEGETEDVRYALTVADLDGGPWSAALLDRIGARDEIDLLFLDGPRAAAEAESLVAEGERSSALVIPAGFSTRLNAGEQAALVFHRNPNRVNPQETRAALDRVLSRLNVELEAAEATASAYAQLWEEPTPEVETRLESRARALIGEMWSEPPVSVRHERLGRAGDEEIPAMGFQHSSPAITLMYVLLNGLVLSSVLVEERRNRTLSRLFTAPVTRAEAVAANFLWRFVVAILQASILVAIGAAAFGVDWGRSPAALLAVFAAFSAAVAGLSVLLGSAARTARQAQSAALVLALSMSALGGLWWPLEITPSAYQSVGHAVPTAWAMDALHGLVSRGYALPEVLTEVWVLLGFAALFSAAAALIFRAD